VKFGPKPAFLHPYHLSGREMAQIQPPTHTLDPKLINFYAEVFHMLFLTSLNHSKSKKDEVRFRDEIWPGMVGLTDGLAYNLCNLCSTRPWLKPREYPEEVD